MAESGVELSPEELLDAVWLAGKLPRGARPLARSADAASATSERHGVHHDGPLVPEPAAAEPTPQPPATDAAEGRSTHPLLASAQPGPDEEVQAAPSRSPAVAVRAPDRSALGAGQLRLGKALRPLRQRFPDPRRREHDIARTVDAIAETGMPDTVTRAVRTRWLSLALVVDDGVSMVLWQRLAADVRALMERAGAFRDVRVYGLDTRGGTPFLRTVPYRHHGRVLTPETLCDPSGSTLVLVVSDGVGEAWRGDGMRQVMDRWGGCGPTAIIQPLPVRLWASTGVAARRWHVTTRRRGGPTRAWHVTDPDLPPDLVRFDSVPVPVLAPTPEAVADWARLVAAPGGTALLPLWDADAAGRTAAASPEGDAADAVLRFREAASPEAYRLAAHVAAVAPTTPPVMRLVQAAVGPPADLGHLMEVFLGGLMHELDACGADRPPHHRRFDFTDDARRVLLSAVSPKELLRTAEAATRHIEAAVGRALVFPAWVGHPDGAAVIDDTARSFGWLREQVLTRLGIPSADAGPVTPGPEPTVTRADGPADSADAGSDEAYDDAPGEFLPVGWTKLRPEDPESLGRFRLRARSADGWPHLTMYLAEDEEGTLATVRAPLRLSTRDPETARDLVRTEAECLTRMRGMHAPALLGVAGLTEGELPWIAAVCVHSRADVPASPPAPNLRAVLAEHTQTIPEGLFLRIGRGLAEAVAAAHSRGLVHGSLSPLTVLVTDRDIRLVGWSTATIDGVDSAHQELLPRSDTYLEAGDGRPRTPQSDVYAVGALLLALLSGRWSDPRADDPERGPLAEPGISPVLVRMLWRCLEHDPALRPSATVLAEAFAAAAAGRPYPGPGVPADESGTVVGGHYRLTRRLHTGMTSTTWSAVHETQGRGVALKLFAPRRSGTASGEEEFLAAARQLAALEIPGMVRVSDYGLHEGRPYLVTDAVDGEALAQPLDLALGALPVEEIRDIGGQLARTLAELHEHGLLHLDLNPSTVVLRRDGRVLVTDPGLCVTGPSRITMRRRLRVRDTPGFLPPYRSHEELSESAAVDRRSDLYSLGCLLYAMVTGAAPDVAVVTPGATEARRRSYPRPELPSGYSPALEALVVDLLEADPADRPANAAEVLARLTGADTDDRELITVHRAVRNADPHGARMGAVLRAVIDQVLSGELTGRYDLKQLAKTERTNLGALVEMAVQREFRFEDGDAMDFRIADIEVDCRFSHALGGWLFPPETLGHICLLVWADDDRSRWSVGLLRVRREWLNAGYNRDRKATLRAEHRNKIAWLWHDAELQENVLLHLSDTDREAVFASTSGQGRLNEFFRRVQGRRIGRAVLRTVVGQRDYMKRVRGNGGSRSALRNEGIIILGDHEAHRRVALQLGLPVPQEGEFVSARVAPAPPGDDRPSAELDDRLWCVASPDDPVHRAPVI
nr:MULTISPECIES: NaeI family type II restriction endonuclease [unclassified Streptomyces]